MRLVPFEPAHVRALINYGGQEHLVEHVRDYDLEQLAAHGRAVTGLDGERIVGCGGLIEATRYRAVGWVLLARHSPRHFPAIHRAALEIIRACPYRRIEAFVDPKSRAAMRWIRLLGFTLERAYLPYFFPDGSGAAAFVLYPNGR